jgi:DNA mismatch endonuclease, patch repair protein
MADVFTPAKRSAVMSRIRGSGNRNTELRMIGLFRLHGITGWRRNVRVFGRPDFVFPREKVAVFVDGCFWHRHGGCKFAYNPKSRRAFWCQKFDRNVSRDRLVTRTLREENWKIVRIWECALSRHPLSVIARVEKARVHAQKPVASHDNRSRLASELRQC